MKMETITVRYDAIFERQVEIPVYDHYENRDLTEYIEQDMEKYKNDCIRDLEIPLIFACSMYSSGIS